jgi:hypothetical protein
MRRYDTVKRAKFYHSVAERCRQLLTTAVRPETVAQLKTWAHEFDGKVRRAERQTSKQGAHSQRKAGSQ